MQLAESSLFLTIAMSLAVFDIAKVDGEALPVHENTSGTIRLVYSLLLSVVTDTFAALQSPETIQLHDHASF